MKLVTTIPLMILMSMSTTVHAQHPNFDFWGHVEVVPDSAGGQMKMFSLLTNNGVVPTPIPMTWTGEEHTLILRASLSGSAGFSQFYRTGTIDLWTDVGTSTPHDFGNSSTLEDGTLILSGVLAGVLTRNKFTPTLGTFIGDINWTGGSRLAELGTTVTGWLIHGPIVVSDNHVTRIIPVGVVWGATCTAL